MGVPLQVCRIEMIGLRLAAIVVVAMGPSFTAREPGRMYLRSTLRVLE